MMFLLQKILHTRVITLLKEGLGIVNEHESGRPVLQLHKSAH
jgi:hypothetical protein